MYDPLFDLSAYFTWKGLRIFQDERVFKVGTDALLLGGWIPRVVQAPMHILDIGTGSGILAMMLSHSFPESVIDGVDINETAVQLASLTARENETGGRIRFLQQDILTLSPMIQRGYNLVVSNPPFYGEGVLPEHELYRRSKHLSDPIMIWMEAMAHYLAADGHICLIVPTTRASQWIGVANDLGYYVNHRLEVYAFRDDARPVRSLLHLTPTLKKPERQEIHIQGQDKGYTEAYTELTGIRSIR